MSADQHEEADEETGLTKETLPVEVSSSTSYDSVSRIHVGRGDESSSRLPILSPLQVVRIPFIQSSRSMGSILSYDSFNQTTDPANANNIRFQVVVWNVGRPDEVLGKVEMKFRVTIFWNNPDETDTNLGYGMNNPYNKKVWKMHGRQRAYQTELSEVGAEDKIVYVPPVSILNAVDFEFLGEPEVCQLNSEENLMKWTCLYRASLIQDEMHVSDFPHDRHDLVLRLGILKHRQARKRWDKARWKLSLANEEDTLETINTPHGTVVDHVHVPGYSYDRQRGLDFEFLPLEHGSRNKIMNSRDRCLQVKLRVMRESSYYDRNIVPLLAALNTVGICTLVMNANQFGARGEMILATAFVEIGIRMTVDSRLPVVGYQIKMQWVLNNFFFGLLFLVGESSIAYLLNEYGYEAVGLVDQCAALAEFLHMLFVLFIYNGKGKLFERSWFNCFKKHQSKAASSLEQRFL